jgi:hypothetical protein
MYCGRVVATLLLVATVWGVLAASGLAQTLSAATGPQQMVPYGVPATYPSTYPSTSPTSYPSTSPMSPAPAPYSPTLAPGVAPLSPYASTAPALSAPGPSAAGSASSLLLPSAEAIPNTGALDAAAAGRPFDNNAYFTQSLANDGIWSLQLLPSGLMYKSYLASLHEPRFASVWMRTRAQGWIWEPVLGGRGGLVRYGTDNSFRPEGYQVDIEGGVLPRLDQDGDVVSSDFRFGVPVTTRQGPWEAKFGYYHFCAHLGDEYMLKYPGAFTRLNYVRDSLVLGVAYYLHPSLRIYSEAGYAFHTDGGAKPWEFQFGAEFSPPEPTGLRGAPFVAINGHLRQENDFGGNVNAQAGWQWRGRNGQLWRMGAQYFNGMSEQGEFYNRFEEQFGAGVWYDF